MCVLAKPGKPRATDGVCFAHERSRLPMEELYLTPSYCRLLTGITEPKRHVDKQLEPSQLEREKLSLNLGLQTVLGVVEWSFHFLYSSVSIVYFGTLH